MRELGPTSRALVTAARDGMSPDPATAARVRAKLAVALGASTTLGAGTASSATSPAPTFAVAQPIARMSLVHKLAIVLGVAAAIGLVVGISRMHVRTSPTGAPALSAPLPDDELSADRAVVPQQAPPVAARPDRVVEAQSPLRAEPAQATLAREVELVDRAMTELRLGNPDAALTIVATFERETLGRGQLAEDIAAISIEASCARGDDVTQPLAAYDHRWPTSAQRTRITAACNR